MGHKSHHHHHRNWKLVEHGALPEWMRRRTNRYLLKGHRPELGSLSECFKSVFDFHVETGNIWTHLIGCSLFLLITIALLLQPIYPIYTSHDVDLADQLPLIIFSIAASICFGFSTIFHTFNCHSEKIGKFVQKLDYAGNIILIFSGSVTYISLWFHCNLPLKWFYLTLSSIFGTGALLAVLPERYAGSECRSFRAAVFTAFGLSGAVPTLNYVFSVGLYNAVVQGSVHWPVISALASISGVIVYIQQFPERLWPGKFDYWCHSHQILHILAVVSALSHYHGAHLASVNRISLMSETGC